MKWRIALVVGDETLVPLLSAFRHLKEACELSIFARRLNLPNIESGEFFEVRTYPGSEDASGFIEGLEADLKGFDAIIGLGSWQFASFQALRSAKRYGVPFICYTAEDRAFYFKQFSTVSAMQLDIFRNADLFWATSTRAREALVKEGVSKSKISVVLPMISNPEIRYSDDARKRFRQYLKIGEAERLLMYFNPLEENFRPDLLLSAGAELAKCNSGAQFRLLFAGVGALSEKLKRDAYLHKIGSLTMFLHQDPQPFLNDLLNAVDILIQPASLEGASCKPPIEIVEAIKCKTIIISPFGSAAAEIAGSGGLEFRALDPLVLANLITPYLNSVKLMEEQKNLALLRMENNFYHNIYADLMVKDLVRLVREKQCESLLDGDFSLLNELESAIESGDDPEIIRITKQIKPLKFDGKFNAACFRLQGDICLRASKFEEAENMYLSALQSNDVCWQAYRGLGYLALQRGAFDDSRQLLKHADSIESGDARTCIYLALAYTRTRELSEAKRWFEKCLNSDSERDLVRSVISQVSAQLGLSLDQVLDSDGGDPSDLRE